MGPFQIILAAETHRFVLKRYVGEQSGKHFKVLGLYFGEVLGLYVAEVLGLHAGEVLGRPS